jgi:hypothetical protein
MLIVEVLGIGGSLLVTMHTTTDAPAEKPGTGVGLTFSLNVAGSSSGR